MKKIYTALLTAFSFVLLLPVVASAQAEDLLGGGDGGEIGDALTVILNFINDILIPFLLAIAFVLFIWGLFKYFIQGGDDPAAQSTGKTYIIYALAFFVVVLAFWGIVNILVSGVGLQDETLQYVPEVIPADTTAL